MTPAPSTERSGATPGRETISPGRAAFEAWELAYWHSADARSAWMELSASERDAWEQAATAARLVQGVSP